MPANMVSIEVDGKTVEVESGVSIKDALESIGYEITMYPSEKGLFMPCQTGGCWTCAVDVDGRLMPACASVAHDGMKIKKDSPEGQTTQGAF